MKHIEGDIMVYFSIFLIIYLLLGMVQILGIYLGAVLARKPETLREGIRDMQQSDSRMTWGIFLVYTLVWPGLFATLILVDLKNRVLDYPLRGKQKRKREELIDDEIFVIEESPQEMHQRLGR